MSDPHADRERVDVGDYGGRPDLWVPPALAEQLGIGVGDEVDAEVRDGELVISPSEDDDD